MTKKNLSTILVTGATGTVGSEVVKQLVSSSTDQIVIRAAVHSENKADKFKKYKAVEIVSIDRLPFTFQPGMQRLVLWMSEMSRLLLQRVLTKNGSQDLNKVYDITGPEALSHSQVAEELSESTGRNISYIDISEEDASKGMKKVGMGDWFIQNAMELYNIYKAGYASETTTVVEQITGRKPISFSQFAKDYVEAFR